MFIVYKVISPSNKVYIGITSKTLHKRKLDHYQCANRGYRKGKFQRALNKYKNQLIWSIIHKTDSWEKACELEKLYIQKYDSFNKGYNCTLGGEGNFGLKHTNLTKQKIAKAHKGKKFTESHKKALSLGQQRYRKNRDNRIKMSKEKGAKPFLVFDLKGNFIKEYISKALCSEDLNVASSNIGKVLKKSRRHAKNYVFIYKEDYYGKTQ